MGRDAAPMRIRLATTEDAAAMSELVHSLSAKYIAIDFDEKGARRLLASMETPAIREYLRSGYGITSPKNTASSSAWSGSARTSTTFRKGISS